MTDKPTIDLRDSQGAINEPTDSTINQNFGTQYIYNQPKPDEPIYYGVPTLTKEIFGRDELIEQLVEQLISGQNRALSTDGAGGVGKTTLAIAIANHPRIRKHFADGILWSGLGQNGDAMDALKLWAEAFGADVTNKLTPQDRARELNRRIGARKMLLVIDDAWSLETAQHMTCGGPNCCHLLTTRDSGLAQHFAPSNVSKVQPLETDDGFEMLQALAPEVCAVDEAAARALVQSVGGLPLALEVLGAFLANPENTGFDELRAEAFVKLKDPNERLKLAMQRLGDRATLSMKEILELSFYDFTDDARRAWHALGAFAHKPAVFDLNAAKAVCDCDARLIAKFVGRNLLEKVSDKDEGKEWLAMHQTWAELARTNMNPEAKTRHRQFYLDLANADRKDWRAIEPAYPQIQFAFTDTDDASAMELIGALLQFQSLRGLWRDQIMWITRGIDICQRSDNHKDEASLLNNIGLVYRGLGQPEKALAFYNRALPISEEVGDRAGQATTLNNIGGVYDGLGQPEKALAFFNRALPIWEEVGDRAGQATTLNNIGSVYNGLGQREKALEFFNRALPIREEVGDRAGQAATLNNIGLVYRGLGQRKKALEFYNRALPIWEEVGDRAGQAATLNNIGFVYDGLGQPEKALEFYNRALPISEEVGDRAGQAMTLNNIGKVYNGLGQPEKALEFYNRALPISEEVGDLNGESITRGNIGILFAEQGRLKEARDYLVRAVQICEEIHSPNLDAFRGWLDDVRKRLGGE
jgi:tetratricopeptide (TPR) repeat protein